MGKLERITVTMPEEMAAKVRAAVEGGDYATTSEVVREALRGWSELQDHRALDLERLKRLVAEADGSELLDGKSVLEDFRAKYRHTGE